MFGRQVGAHKLHRQLVRALKWMNISWTQLAQPPKAHASFGRRDYQEDKVLGGKVDVHMPLICKCPLIVLRG